MNVGWSPICTGLAILGWAQSRLMSPRMCVYVQSTDEMHKCTATAIGSVTVRLLGVHVRKLKVLLL